MSPPSSSLRATGGARSPAVSRSPPSQGSRNRMSSTRVDALRDLSRPVPAQQRMGRLRRLPMTTPMTQQQQRPTLTGVVAALPSKKWPRRKRSPSPPRRNNNDDDDIEIIPPAPARPPSLWRWRARARGHRHERQRLRLGLPRADWSRQNLQVLFVDESGVTRGRFAALLTERVGDWCGLGRALAPSAAGLYSVEVDDERGATGGGEGKRGIDADAGEASSFFDASGSGSAAALMAQASRLSLRPKALAAPRAPPFELGDLDAFDLVIAVDTETRDKIFELLGGEASADARFYAPRIARLGDFAACRSPGKPVNSQGSDTLDEELAAMLSDPSGFSGSLSALGNVVLSSSSSPPSLPSAEEGGDEDGSGGSSSKNSFDVPRVPSLSGPTSGEDFDRMIERTVRGVAGLVQYLADGLPLDGDGGER